jgi:hypothetical protein
MEAGTGCGSSQSEGWKVHSHSHLPVSNPLNNLAASNATADSRANEIMDPRKEDSDKVVNITKPETGATHDPDHKILVVITKMTHIHHTHHATQKCEEEAGG